MEHRKKAVAGEGEARETASIRKAAGVQCDSVCDTRGERMADAAARFSTLATVLLLLREVASDGSVGAAQRRVTGSGSEAERKKKAPTAAIIDSQSVKMAGQPGERGYDAGKKVDGRKRHLLVDSLGLILRVVVHRADIQDRDGAKLLLERARWFGWLQVIWADGGYAGKLLDWVAAARLGRRARLEIVKKSDAPGFTVLPRRWVVERTHAWLSRYRRLARDYEVKTDHSEAFTYIASCSLLARRLAISNLK